MFGASAPNLIEDYKGREVQGPSTPVLYEFRWWRGLLVPPTREEWSVKWFTKLHISGYWPCFTEKKRVRGHQHRMRLCAMMPGLMFVPEEMLAIPRRDEILEYAHSRGFLRQASGVPARVSKADIEIIREIEAELNLPPKEHGLDFDVGDRICFIDDVYAAFWGTGVVFEVASESRIGVEVEKAIGGPTKVFVPASKIERL